MLIYCVFEFLVDPRGSSSSGILWKCQNCTERQFQSLWEIHRGLSGRVSMKSNRQVLVSRCLFSDHLFLCFFYLICSVPFLSVSLSSGVISGAITSQYLLEKSRIVFQVRHADIHIEDDVPCFHPKYSELYAQDRLDV